MDAGLPNITGDVAFGRYDGYIRVPRANGAFNTITAATSHANSESSGSVQVPIVATFDASRCSSTYRDDLDSVQPAALAMRYFIKY